MFDSKKYVGIGWLALGVVLAIFAVIGIILPNLVPEIKENQMFSFPLGFLTGIFGGFGAVLLIINLLNLRKMKK